MKHLLVVILSSISCMACAQNQPKLTEPPKALLSISDSGGKKTVLTHAEVIEGKSTRDEFYFTYTLETDYTEKGDTYKTVATYTCQMYHVSYGEYRVMERLDSLVAYENGKRVGNAESSEYFTHVGNTSQKSDASETAIRVWSYMKKRSFTNQVAEAEKNAFLVLDKKDDTISYVSSASISPSDNNGSFTLTYSTAWLSLDKDDIQSASSSYQCSFILQEDGSYRIEGMLRAKSFYSNGQPSGHADPTFQFRFIGNSDNDSLLEVRLWKLLTEKE